VSRKNSPRLAGSASDPRDDSGVSHLRVPPHSLEAEQNVLGALLLIPDSWDRVADLLNDRDFYRYEHKLIFDAISTLVAANKPVDSYTVFEALTAAKKADDAGGLPYVNSLSQAVPNAANIRRYAEVVRERSIRRQIVAAGDEACSVGFDDEGDVAEKLDRVAAMFANLQEHSVRGVPEHVGDLMAPLLDGMNELANGTKPSAWSTGDPYLDRILDGGFRPGEVITLAARPSVGKSSKANKIAKAFALAGHPVVFLSQEMPKKQCMLRFISEDSGIELAKLKTGQLNDLEWSILSESVDRVRKLPIFIDDEPALTGSAIQGKVGSKRRDQPKLLVLDFIQECAGDPGGRDENRARDLGKIMQIVKTLAKRIGMAVLVLSQLNRAVETRASPEPTMSDLRESGAIEQSSDVVLFLWNHALYTGYRVVGHLVAKNRDGENMVRYAQEFHPKTQRWEPSEVDVSPKPKTFSNKPTSAGYNYADDDL
jgi:replicative DNA helicase